MAFESLSERLNKTFKNITGKGKLSEKNMNDMLREVRMSLLEADVNYQVVKEFIEKVKNKALGQEVMDALNPGQMVVKIVHDEIMSLLGDEDANISYKAQGITIIMIVGLQGTGKTTAAAKIASLVQKKQNRKPLLVACDLVRPAAIEQLQTLGESIGVKVFAKGVESTANETALSALAYAKSEHFDTMIIDTAGRLHIDETLMKELQDLEKNVTPDEILLNVDAMSGQDIVNVAKTFHEQLSIKGLIVTKLDGDARGGGVLSVKSITQLPVKFVGMGEKIEDLDVFHPDRMTDRILGMGDILSLVEQAQDKMDLEESNKTAKRMMSGKFSLNDMLSQFQQLKKMGSLGGMMKLIPGMNQMASTMDEAKADDKLKKNEAIILSMTQYERIHPEILKASRKNRIAKGSGTQVSEVNRMLADFEKMKQVMKQMGGMNGNAMGGMKGMGALKGMNQMRKIMKNNRRR